MTPAATALSPAKTSIVVSVAQDPAAAENFFKRALLVTSAVKLLLAAIVPFTTDEAYFVLWGRRLDYGYYDHGAMTGWWMWFMLLFGDSAFLLRLPAVAVSQFAGWGLWRMLRPIDPAKAGWAATLYLVSPLNLFIFPITTDTPLLFFSVVAVMFTLRGVQGGRLIDYGLAGLALGFAFLSKYFAVLLGVSFAVLLLGCVGRPRIKELAILLSGIVPGVAVNVAWNYHHSWTNILFNLYTRQEKTGFSLVPPLLFLGTIAVLAGPGVIRALLRPQSHDAISASTAWRSLRANGSIVLALAFAFPMAIFLVVAFGHEIGVHWVLSFFQFLSALLFAFFGADGLRRMIRPTAIYTAVPVTLV
ncbi:MAG: glycosyltransferase family 39 protein, partial [Opitutaceae bacterium]